MSIDFVPELINRTNSTPKREMTEARRQMLRYNTRRGPSRIEPVEDHAARTFANSTGEHEMTILHDDGVYRHIRFAKPGTGLWSWTLTTWPGHLCIDGDLESFTFAREHDMFEFFAYDRGRINPHYWSEKITNHDARKATRKFSTDKATVALVNDFMYQRHYRTGATLPAWRHLREMVIDEIYDGCDSTLFHELVNRWSYDNWHFQDTYEWDTYDWDFHYLIACHAIAWGINKYRQEKQA